MRSGRGAELEGEAAVGSDGYAGRDWSTGDIVGCAGIELLELRVSWRAAMADIVGCYLAEVHRFHTFATQCRTDRR